LDLLVGAFVLLGIAAVLFLALRVAGSATFRNGDGYTLTANFENIGGLKARAPVKSAGVVVGRVVGIEFDNQAFEAKVVMQIDKKYQFQRDTVAKINTSGLLGEQYLGLAAGGDVVNLKDGDMVKMTQSAVVLENLIGQFLYSKAADGDSKK
jgi:phospholipid/cholesterol/gamma-HCH transport system substrate-binding protein